jgi:hypothetical protein
MNHLWQNSLSYWQISVFGKVKLSENDPIITFLNKLKIVENTNPFRDSHAPSCLSGRQTDVPAEPPLIGPDYNNTTASITLQI